MTTVRWALLAYVLFLAAVVFLGARLADYRASRR